jgi:hypothetical protein
MMSPGTDESRSSTSVSSEPVVYNWGHTVQYMLRNPWAYDEQQLAQQRAYEVGQHHDFGDCGHLLSCDSIESVEEEARPERHLRWLREANSDPYAGVSNEIDDIDQDIQHHHCYQPGSPTSSLLQAIQLPYIAESGDISDAAVAILEWTTQEVLDAAHSIGLASSSQLPSEQPGVCVSDAVASPVSPFNHPSILM